MNRKLAIVGIPIAITILVICGFSMTVTGSDIHQVYNETKEAKSSTGIKYVAEFSNSTDTISVTATNQGSKNRTSSLSIYVDGYQREVKTLELSHNESWSKTWNISKNIDATQEKHQVSISTSGDMVSFNFTSNIDLSNSSKVPTPRITNVTVTNGTVYGNETAILEVTVENPADQLYGSNLMVHTLKTNHSRVGGATAAPGSTSTVQVPLDEPQGATVAGEVRLYDRNLSDAEDGFDQREFVGRAGGDTQVWNRTYEPVEPYWGESSGYRYENETMEERIDDSDEESLDPVSVGLVAGLGVLVATLLSLAAWRLR
jgi:hypothetical protein